MRKYNPNGNLWWSEPKGKEEWRKPGLAVGSFCYWLTLLGNCLITPNYSLLFCLEYFTILFHITYSEIPGRQLRKKGVLGNGRNWRERGKRFYLIKVFIIQLQNRLVVVLFSKLVFWFLITHTHTYTRIHAHTRTHKSISAMLRIFNMDLDVIVTRYIIHFKNVNNEKIETWVPRKQSQSIKRQSDHIFAFMAPIFNSNV